MADVLIVESDSAIRAETGSSVKALRYVNKYQALTNDTNVTKVLSS
jgi:hypothetical protein